LSGLRARQPFRPDTVEDAARLLIELAARAAGQKPDTPDVLVDLTVGYTRCLVTRVASVPATAVSDVLSPREQEIARMVARGYTNKEIAKVLEISLWTVSTHLRRVFSKLDVSTRAAMVARLLRNSGNGHPGVGATAPASEARQAAAAS
jgi:DNA-binding CsgD family transcriptional regulator